MVQSPPTPLTETEKNEAAFNERMAQLRQQAEQGQDIRKKQLEREQASMFGLAALPLIGIAGLFQRPETKIKKSIDKERSLLELRYNNWQKLEEKKVKQKTIAECKHNNPKASQKELRKHVQEKMAIYKTEALENKASYQSNLQRLAYQNYERSLIKKDPRGEQLEAYHKRLIKNEELQKWNIEKINGDIVTSKNYFLQANAEKQVENPDTEARTQFFKKYNVKEKNFFGFKKPDQQVVKEVLKRKTFISDPNNQALITNKLQPSIDRLHNYPYIAYDKEKSIVSHKKLTPAETTLFTQNLEQQRKRLAAKSIKHEAVLSNQTKIQQRKKFIQTHPAFIKNIKTSPSIAHIPLVRKPNLIDHMIYIQRLLGNKNPGTWSQSIHPVFRTFNNTPGISSVRQGGFGRRFITSKANLAKKAVKGFLKKFARDRIQQIIALNIGAWVLGGLLTFFASLANAFGFGSQ